MHLLRSSVLQSLALLGTATGTAHTQTPTYNISGVSVFWETVAILEADREPTDAEWARLMEHPGYAQIERQGQRGQAVRTCLPLVFRPSMQRGLAAALDGKNSRVRRVCAHLQEVLQRRAELAAWMTRLSAGDDLARAIERTKGYLPSGATEGMAPPPVYVLLFERNGFGGASLALDALALLDRSGAGRIGYLAHEFHHAYRGRIDRITIDRDAPDYLLVAALSSLAEEGIASLLDKRGFLDDDHVAGLAGREREIANQFREHHQQSDALLTAVDSQLVALQRGATTAAEAGRAIKSGLPWGGHILGMFMAMAIEETLGQDALIATNVDPLEFVLVYQHVAERAEKYPRFSRESIAIVHELQRKYRSPA